MVYSGHSIGAIPYASSMLFAMQECLEENLLSSNLSVGVVLVYSTITTPPSAARTRQPDVLPELNQLHVGRVVQTALFEFRIYSD